MKIADIGTISKETQTSAAVMDKPSAGGLGSSFQRHMSNLNREDYEEYIEDLKNKILEQGEVIKNNADIPGFLKYRKLISELINEAASNAYITSRSGAFDSRGKHKVFIMIRKVNVKLDEMAQEILSEQSDNLKLLDMVDDIRGMLVDLFL